MDTRDQTLTKLTRLHDKSNPSPSGKSMMELLMQGSEHHEIDDGGRLMMMMAMIFPLRSPERTPYLLSR